MQKFLHLQIQKLHSRFRTNFFQNFKVALTSFICFPIGLMFHQRLNSHKISPGSPPEPSNLKINFLIAFQLQFNAHVKGERSVAYTTYYCSQIRVGSKGSEPHSNQKNIRKICNAQNSLQKLEQDPFLVQT